jgi:DNA-binding transcriptional ArsR family regulator
MKALPEHRDRDDTEVAVLDALAGRGEEGMTVFELRSRVEVDIDTLEQALADLKDDGLIEATKEDGRTVIVPEDHAIGTVDPDEESLFGEIRDRLPF